MQLLSGKRTPLAHTSLMPTPNIYTTWKLQEVTLLLTSYSVLVNRSWHNSLEQSTHSNIQRRICSLAEGRIIILDRAAKCSNEMVKHRSWATWKTKPTFKALLGTCEISCFCHVPCVSRGIHRNTAQCNIIFLMLSNIFYRPSSFSLCQ